MIQAESLPFSGSDLGIKKGFEFDGVTYFLRLRKNSQGGFFTIEIFDSEDNFIYSGPIHYRYEFGIEVFADLPFTIVPLDINEFFASLEVETEVTDDNLGDTVKLYTSLSVS